MWFGRAKPSVFVLRVPPSAQPQRALFLYPPNNPDFGVEQDLLKHLRRAFRVVAKPADAEWHLLPVYWTRWHLNHNYGSTGLDRLQQICDDAILDDSKTFTVCQYDDGPIANLGKTLVYLSSRKGHWGRDIPLLRSGFQPPTVLRNRKYLATFVGRDSTHPLRKELVAHLTYLEQCYCSTNPTTQRAYFQLIADSYIVLAPRGYGGSSFRFYEAMACGVIPALIGDIDTRPFPRHIRWNDMSFHASDIATLVHWLKTTRVGDLRHQGRAARETYWSKLAFGRWIYLLAADLSQ
jgi:hypothetical protein